MQNQEHKLANTYTILHIDTQKHPFILYLVKICSNTLVSSLQEKLWHSTDTKMGKRLVFIHNLVYMDGMKCVRIPGYTPTCKKIRK